MLDQLTAIGLYTSICERRGVVGVTGSGYFQKYHSLQNAPIKIYYVGPIGQKWTEAAETRLISATEKAKDAVKYRKVNIDLHSASS